jgi:hypothetical protein
MGLAPIAFLAFSVVLAIYLWRSAPSARTADERRRWWAFTDRADPNPYFGSRDNPGPGGGPDDQGRSGGSSDPF